MTDYKAVRVEAGRGGWGGPLTIKPTADRPLVYSVTGGGIHPVAAKIAEADRRGGLRRLQELGPLRQDRGRGHRLRRHRPGRVYPMKKVPTVDVHATSPAGPLAMFIKEDIFVSGVGPDNVKEA